ncbi:hypothetical protein [Bhargavaea cecembensis]|nr:hypothetical protein [Bhargavaea cecembensis]
MFIVRPAVGLYDRGGLVTAENSEKGTVEAAVRKGELNFLRFSTLLNQGFSSNAAEQSREYAYAKAFLNKFPGLFMELRSERERAMLAAARSDLEVFRNLFLTGQPFGRIEQTIKNFASHGSGFRIWFAADPERFPQLRTMLGKIPYLQVDTKKRNGRYHAAIVESTNPMDREEVRAAAERVLFVDLTRSRMEVGPLIVTDRFRMPEPQEAAPDPPQEGPGEAALLYFFIRRILFAVLFGLEEDLSEDVGLPLRSRLTIDRISLEGRAEAVVTSPLEMNTPVLHRMAGS